MPSLVRAVLATACLVAALSLSATASSAADPAASSLPALRSPAALGEAFRISADGTLSWAYATRAGAFPDLPSVTSNGEAAFSNGSCGPSTRTLSFYAVVGGRLAFDTLDEGDGAPCDGGTSLSSWTGGAGWGDMRQLVWARPGVPDVDDRLYALSSSGVLYRYSVSQVVGQPRRVTGAGSAAGFASVRSLALVHSDAARDVFLANLTGGSLYEVTFPWAPRAATSARVVRAAGWGGLEQLYTRPLGPDDTDLSGLDRDTGQVSSYPVGRVQGTSTVIGPGEVQASLETDLVLGTATTSRVPYRGAGPAVPAGATMAPGAGIAVWQDGRVDSRWYGADNRLPTLPRVVSNAERAPGAACYDDSWVRYFAVVDGLLARGSLHEIAAGECNSYQRVAATAPGLSGYPGVRQVAWATETSAVAAQRLYTLTDDGTLHRYEVVEDSTPTGFVLRDLGSVPGFTVVRSMALVHADAARDVLLMNLSGGGLYSVTVPATTPMATAASQVRSRTWGGIDQLAAVPRPGGGVYLTGVDAPTGIATSYVVGPLRRTATAISTIGRAPVTYRGAVVDGGKDEAASYRGG